MRRQYNSPMTGFIYVEPYEVHKEIIVRPADIQRYVEMEWGLFNEKAPTVLQGVAGYGRWFMLALSIVLLRGC